MAAHDLVARRLGLPLAALFGRVARPSIALSWVASARSPEEAERQAITGLRAGYQGFKVKLGLNAASDTDIVRAARAIGPASYLWAGANQAYTGASAVRLARSLAALGVDVLEQPVAAPDTDGLRRVRAAGHLPIAVDESVFSAADLLRLLRADAFDVLVLTVSKLGGLWHARRCL